MTINYESKVEEVVVLSVGCSVSLGRLDKAIKKITIDRSILPTKSLPNHRLNITVFDTLLSKVMVKTFPSSSLSFPSHFFHLSCQPLATKPCNPKQTLLVTLLLEVIVTTSPSQSSYFLSSSLFLLSLLCCPPTPIEPSPLKTTTSTIVLLKAKI